MTQTSVYDYIAKAALDQYAIVQGQLWFLTTPHSDRNCDEFGLFIREGAKVSH
ncbi:hypothetical protein IQ238_09085 [Pleurocapsales cyanobacterium LEGE 06147]|nr:hypothetical protein [Pleurocapsales cyanobacterium LEGE 06147]